MSAHDIAAFGAIFADDYVNHQMSAAAPAPPPDKSPKQATVGFFAARLAGIPDLKVAVEATVASNDMVAVSFVYTGTHKGPLFGIAPTGRSLRFTSCDIFRVKNRQCTEHWGMGDIAGVLAQLRASHRPLFDRVSLSGIIREPAKGSSRCSRSRRRMTSRSVADTGRGRDNGRRPIKRNFRLQTRAMGLHEG